MAEHGTSPPTAPAAATSPTASPAAAAASPASAGSPPAGSPAAVVGNLEALDNPEEDDNDSALGEENSTFTASITSSILKYRTLNGRTYHSDRVGSDYWGPNDEQQNNLLDIQHHVFTLLLGNKLNWAPLPEKVNKVLDLGTGTGSWAIDFADEHPESEVIGTDLSPIQPTWVPPNVQFQIDDFSLPWTFAEDTFDYVHIRWLVGSVADWKALFAQAYRVLKPGGWIETLDTNAYFESDDGTVTDQTAAGQWAQIFFGGAAKLGIKSSFAIPDDRVQRPALEAAGFVGLEETAFKIPFSEWTKDPKLREIGVFARAAFENDTEGSISLLASQIGYTPEEITVYAARLRKEMRSMKIHAYYRANLIYAQKPVV